MTYMEVRFLVDDLGVMPKDDPEPEPEVIDPAEEAAVPQPDPLAEGPLVQKMIWESWSMMAWTRRRRVARFQSPLISWRDPGCALAAR